MPALLKHTSSGNRTINGTPVTAWYVINLEDLSQRMKACACSGPQLPEVGRRRMALPGAAPQYAARYWQLNVMVGMAHKAYPASPFVGFLPRREDAKEQPDSKIEPPSTRLDLAMHSSGRLGRRWCGHVTAQRPGR